MMRTQLFRAGTFGLVVVLLGLLAVFAHAGLQETNTQRRPATAIGEDARSAPPPGYLLGSSAAGEARVRLSEATIARLTRNLAAQGQEKRAWVGVEAELPNVSAPWEHLVDSTGRASWRTAVSSPGATFLRARLSRLSLPADATIAVYGASGAGPIKELKASLDGRPFWTPLIRGDLLHIEVVTASPTTPDIRIDRVSHGLKTLERPSKESWCYLDPTCYPEWDDVRDALVHLTFSSGGGTYVCSGALLTDAVDSFRPWVTTANHCVGYQSEADSVEVTFFFHTAICDGGRPDFFSLPSRRGADLKVTDISVDVSLLLLDEDAPNNASYLGWSLRDNSPGTTATALHHPDGEYARISFGSLLSTSNAFLTVRYTESSTEGGSSGCPLLNQSGQLIGTLSGGDAACSFMAGTDEYARFTAAWAQGFEYYLNGDNPIDDDDDGDDDDDDDEPPAPSDDDDNDDSGGSEARSREDDGGGCGC
ncbi:MAG: trypsin-like peptidase domain-containing protein [Candidatus Lernaella stagnicola]|nr:trypsin-like peptidase domain-containing protein [Candidatus Lernaella stagnicola]